MLSLEEEFGAAANVRRAENAGIQSCHRYASRGYGTEFSFPFTFPDGVKSSLSGKGRTRYQMI